MDQALIKISLLLEGFVNQGISHNTNKVLIDKKRELYNKISGVGGHQLTSRERDISIRQHALLGIALGTPLIKQGK